jgi:hypothetical protein
VATAAPAGTGASVASAEGADGGRFTGTVACENAEDEEEDEEEKKKKKMKKKDADDDQVAGKTAEVDTENNQAASGRCACKSLSGAESVAVQHTAAGQKSKPVMVDSTGDVRGERAAGISSASVTQYQLEPCVPCVTLAHSAHAAVVPLMLPQHCPSPSLPDSPARHEAHASEQATAAAPPVPQTHQAANSTSKHGMCPEAPSQASPGCGSASPLVATRPLSPHGRLAKARATTLTSRSLPDLSAVKARYLEPAGSPSNACPERATSPEMSPARKAAHGRYRDWRLRKMYHDVPDYRHSQPRMSDRMHCLDSQANMEVVTLKQVL